MASEENPGVILIDWIRTDESAAWKRKLLADNKLREEVHTPEAGKSALTGESVSPAVRASLVDDLLLRRDHPAVILIREGDFRKLVAALERKAWHHWVERDGFFFFGVLPENPDAAEWRTQLPSRAFRWPSDTDLGSSVVPRIELYHRTAKQRGFSRLGYYLRRKIDLYAEPVREEDSEPDTEEETYPPPPVLILGDSRTGKEVVADALLAAAGLSEDGIMRVACGSMHQNLLLDRIFGHWKGAHDGAKEHQPGYLEKFDAVLLDDIDAGDDSIQGALLRVLGESPPRIQRLGHAPPGEKDSIEINTWLLVTSNQNPEKLVADGKMRQDFYFRFTHVIYVPPFLDRRNDIPFIARSLTEKRRLRLRPELDLDALRWLRDRKSTWSRNAWELQTLLIKANEVLRFSGVDHWCEALDFVDGLGTEGQGPFYPSEWILGPEFVRDPTELLSDHTALKDVLRKELGYPSRRLWLAIGKEHHEGFVQFLRNEMLNPSCEAAFNELLVYLENEKRPAPIHVLKILAALIFEKEKEAPRVHLRRCLGLGENFTGQAAERLADFRSEGGFKFVNRTPEKRGGNRKITYRVARGVVQDESA